MYNPTLCMFEQMDEYEVAFWQLVSKNLLLLWGTLALNNWLNLENS